MQTKTSNTIAIIGAGAAGLMAAITASKAGSKVHLYEQNNKPAKKILASGNGRCNISNTKVSSSDYFGQNPEFSSFALKNFSFTQLQKFCKSIGLLLNILDDGRAYPLSNEAKSVALSFETYAKSCGVEIFNEYLITQIEKKEDKFYLHTPLNISEAYEKVLICTGSEAAPQLGGSSSGHELASSLGHTIIPTYPSLVQLHINSSLHERMSGIKIDAEVALFLNNKKEQSIKGDILFTKYGISGFAILDISQMASEALSNHQVVDISLDLLPNYDRQTLSSQLLQMTQSLPSHPIETILSGLLPIKLSKVLLEDVKISPQTLGKDIHTKMAKQIVSKIKDWRFDISDTHGFKHAEVSGGGINTDEVNEKTMESKKCKGLYFAGEVLDIVGRRGGFNFHFAWASAYLAGIEMSR
ncbi:NAD(P)/FAD-dependent oxidoreductase [Campylobacterota bacterium]